MIVELENLLAFLTQIVFLFVAGSTLVNWLVFRNFARFDIALIFLPLALAILAQNLLRLFPGWETLLAPVFFLALLSHPHLLLRVAQYFRPVPVVVRRASLVSLLLIVASLPLAETAPLAVFTPAIGYFMVVETYAGVLFVQGAMKLGGVARRRLRLASLGAGLLALVFTLSLGMVLYSAGNEPSLTTRTIVNSSIQVIAMLSGLCYYFGFSPPRWLRRSWQLRELHRFLQQASKRKEYSRRAVFEELANEENFDLIADMVAETAFFRFSDGDYRGRDALRAAFERTWRGDPSIRKSSFSLSEIVVLTTDSHSATATYNWTWEGSQGDQRFQIHGRGTRVLLYREGRFQILHEHLSRAPAG